MKIATWNIERMKHRALSAEMLYICAQVNPDILVLTESDISFQPALPHAFHTPLLYTEQPGFYQPTENRVSIYTRYRCIAQHETYDARTSLCLELDTEIGPIIVYGTIIGIYGNRHISFKQDLTSQIEDFHRLYALNKPICIVGDYNCSFSDNYYFTSEARSLLMETFHRLGIVITTKSATECIDHIAITKDLIVNSDLQIEEWNLDKRLSDHKGISVTFAPTFYGLSRPSPAG